MRTFTLTDAERQRVEQIDALVALGERGVQPLLGMLDDPSWTVRRAAIASLAALGDDVAPALCAWLRSARTSEHAIAAAVDALVEARGETVSHHIVGLLGDADPAVVCDAAAILGRRRARGHADDVAALLDHPDDNVAVAAIEALGRIGAGLAFDSLASLLSARNFFRTFPALHVLAASDDPRAVRAIAMLLAEPLYRDEAIRALGRTGRIEAIAPIVNELADDNVGTIASALADLIERARWTGGMASVVAELEPRLQRHQHRFVTALASVDLADRLAAITVLGAVGDRDAAPPLANLLDDQDLQAPVTRALRQIVHRDSNALDSLLVAPAARTRATAVSLMTSKVQARRVRALLSDDEPDVRAAACAALAQIGDVDAVPGLFAALADPSGRVAHAAVAAINSLGNRRNDELAVAAMQSASSLVRRQALRIFGYLGTPSAFDAAQAALGDSDPKVVEAAIATLATIEDERAAALLLELVRSEDLARRTAAMRAAARRGGDALVPVLLAGATDPAPWVRYYACQGLGRHGGAPALPLLIERLADDMPHVRVAAIEALAYIRTPEVRETLVARARSEDADEQRAALTALALHDREGAVDVLVEALESGDLATQLVALSALAPARSPAALDALASAARSTVQALRDAAIALLSERSDLGAARTLVALAEEAPLGDAAHEALSLPGAARTLAIGERISTADPAACVALCAALARMATDDATQLLFATLSSANASARRTAAVTLSAMRVAGAASAVARLAAEDPDPEVRQICSALGER